MDGFAVKDERNVTLIFGIRVGSEKKGAIRIGGSRIKGRKMGFQMLVPRTCATRVDFRGIVHTWYGRIETPTDKIDKPCTTNTLRFKQFV